ncbi:MAG: hypothetical protein K2I16_06640 [Muribaculaceae bacterium]|nr:hypothetical protein [Muribaculaceae bacterium]
MAIEEVLTYLQDVLDAINDMESCFVDFPYRYDLFEKDIMRKCVVERKTEIMGEASQLKFEQTINGYFMRGTEAQIFVLDITQIFVLDIRGVL